MAIDLFGIGLTAYWLAIGAPELDELKKYQKFDEGQDCCYDSSVIPNGIAKHIIMPLLRHP